LHVEVKTEPATNTFPNGVSGKDLNKVALDSVEPAMKYRLMDLLACPICKHFPLKLKVFEERRRTGEIRVPSRTCEEYCEYKRSWVRDLKEKPCEECYRIEIVEGILVCPECNRWYPIIDEIPHMLPDNLRNKNEDLSFLKKHKNEVDEEVLRSGKPFNLSGA